MKHRGEFCFITVVRNMSMQFNNRNNIKYVYYTLYCQSKIFVTDYYFLNTFIYLVFTCIVKPSKTHTF